MQAHNFSNIASENAPSPGVVALSCFSTAHNRAASLLLDLTNIGAVRGRVHGS